MIFTPIFKSAYLTASQLPGVTANSYLGGRFIFSKGLEKADKVSLKLPGNRTPKMIRTADRDRLSLPNFLKFLLNETHCGFDGFIFLNGYFLGFLRASDQ